MPKITHQSVDSDMRIYAGIKPDLEEVKSSLAQNTYYISLKKFPRLAGETVDNPRIQRAIDSTFPVTLKLLRDNAAVRGGGIVEFINDGSVLEVNAPIKVPALVKLRGNGTYIKATAAVNVFEVKGTTGLYDANGIEISSFIIDGNNLSPIGLRLVRVVKSTFNNLLIFNTTSHGISLEQCQWNNFDQVNVQNCGGFGLWMGKSSDNGYRSNNNTFVRCLFQENTLGGANIREAHINSFYNCTFQFSETGVGILMDSIDCFANLISNGHFEDNYYHVKITNSGAENNKFDSCGFNSNNNTVYTSFYNEGTKTILQDSKFINSVQFKNIVHKYGTGSISISGYDGNVYNIDGVEINQSYSTSATSGVSVINYPIANNGIRFTGFSFSNYSQSASTNPAYDNNYLQIGNYRVWIDSKGNLRVVNGHNPTSDTDGNVFVQTMYGTTAQRPSSPTPFQPFYDKTLQKTIWFNNDTGTWKDAMGTNV